MPECGHWLVTGNTRDARVKSPGWKISYKEKKCLQVVAPFLR